MVLGVMVRDGRSHLSLGRAIATLMLLSSLLAIHFVSAGRISLDVEEDVDTSTGDTVYGEKIGTSIEDTAVDSSWPTLHEFESDVFQQTAPLHNKIRYQDYLHGCFAVQGGYEEDCYASEKVRIDRNRVQPPTMNNMTDTGYTKLPIPSNAYHILSQFWKRNVQFAWQEYWTASNTNWNHWKQPCSVLDLGRQDYPQYISKQKQQQIVSSVQHVLEDWTGRTLVLTASVGIRAYLEGTIIAPHLDVLPFVITAALHIAEYNVYREWNDDDNGWPLQLVVQDEWTGRPTLRNVSSTPGYMIVYEGASIIHGRPYPLQAASSKQTKTESNDKGGNEGNNNDEADVDGKNVNITYVAILFLHFEPVGYTVQHTLEQKRREKQISQSDNDAATQSLSLGTPITTEAIDHASKGAFERALQIEHGKAARQQHQKHLERHENDPQEALPPLRALPETVPRYVWKDYQGMYQQRFVYQHERAIYPKPSKVVFGTITAHQAAALGDLLALKSLAEKDRNQLFKADINGWRPLHEAARSGYADVLEYLLEEGAQVNARTNHGNGGTALYWAEQAPQKNSKAIAVLKKYGGVNIPPQYKDN